MKVRSIIGIIAAVIVIISSGMHSLMGWPAMLQQLRATNASSDLITGLKIGWLWGGVAILVFGVISLMIFVHRLRGDQVPTIFALIIGAAYAAFGVWAIVTTSNPFFIIFILPGILLMIAAR
jgi:hypothetical protein